MTGFMLSIRNTRGRVQHGMQALKLEERIDCISWIPMILVPEASEIMLVYTQN